MSCVATCPRMSVHHGHRAPRHVTGSGIPYEEVAVVDGSLTLVMRNGVPEGDDSPAARYDAMRGSWF